MLRLKCSRFRSSLAGAIATVSFWDSRSGGGWNETLLLSTARFDLAAASAGSQIVFAGGTYVQAFLILWIFFLLL